MIEPSSCFWRSAILCGILALILMIRVGLAGADDNTPIDRSTGIEFAWRTLRMTPPMWWEVTDAGSGRRVTRVEQRWGKVPLPPGTYRVEAQLGEMKGNSGAVVVRPGTVTKLDPGDLGLGQLIVELPAARGIQTIPGVSRLKAQFVQGDRKQPLNSEAAGSRQVTIWAREGPATIRFQEGTVLLDESTNVVRGNTRHVPFDAEALAAKLGLSLVSIVIRDPTGKVATRGTQVIFLDSQGEHLLALTSNPPPGATWLIPPGSMVRARHGDREQVRARCTHGVHARRCLRLRPPTPGQRLGKDYG